MAAPIQPTPQSAPDDWPARYDHARALGARRPQALREAVGVNDRGEVVQ